MKGYFSELARHTGLRTGGSAATALRSPPSAQQNIRSEVKGLEVQEVAFISSSQPPTAERPAVAESTDVETISTDTVRRIPDRSDAPRSDLAPTDRDSHPESDFNRTQFFSDATVEVPAGNPAGSKARAEEGSVPSAEMGTAIIEQPRIVISEQTSTRTRTPDANQMPESVSALEERNSISEVGRYDSPDRNQQRGGIPVEPDPDRFARAAEPADAGLDERIERQTIVRNYLREISEWISTPASPEAEPDSFISADSVASAEDQARRPARSNATPRADAPEQQDLSLSIGTIKIVVEEPRKEAPVSAAPPAKPEAAFERTRTASTDLSRYYLNRW